VKQVNVTFQFSKDCPHNLSGTCVYRGIGLVVDNSDCKDGRCKEPPSWCPLPTAENSGAQPAQTNNSAMLKLPTLEECVKQVRHIWNEEYIPTEVSEAIEAVLDFIGRQNQHSANVNDVTSRCPVGNRFHPAEWRRQDTVESSVKQ